jgi:hypothetical protein
VDPSTGTTSNSALKFAHRVGANVKITDFPVLQILRNQAAGADKDVCGACRLPSSIYPIHSNGVCGPCARWQFYLRLNDDQRGAIRKKEAERWRTSHSFKRSSNNMIA